MSLPSRNQVAVYLAVAVLVTGPSALAEGGTPSIWTLTEQDDDGGRAVRSNASAIVDINSVIDIELNREALRERIGETLNLDGFPSEQVRLMQDLQRGAMEGLATVPRLHAALEEYAASEQGAADVEALAVALDAAARPALGIVDSVLVRGIQGISDPFNRIMDQPGQMPVHEQYALIFALAADEAERLGDELAVRIQSEAVYIQLGAWISNESQWQPLHLPGFDRYPEGEYFKVERWRIAPTESQLTTLAALRDSARVFNERQVDILQLLKGDLHRLTDSIGDEVTAYGDRLEQALRALKSRAEGEAEPLVDRLDRLMLLLRRYIEVVEPILARYVTLLSNPTIDVGSLLNGLVDDYRLVRTETELLIAGLKTSAPDIRSLVADARPQLKTAAAEFDSTVTACIVGLESKVVEVAKSLATTLGIDLGLATINTAALEFGAEVFKLDVDQVPDRTTLNLLLAGPREPGATVFMKIAAGRADPRSETSATPPRVLQTGQLKLFKILPHVETAAGMVFANPHGNSAVQTEYQAAAGYSVIFKTGSRKSAAYNRIFNPGIGLNLAVVDFNGDDTPETAVGLMVSLFRDMIQFGWGYNLMEGQAYDFFGLRFPLPSLTLSGSSVPQTAP